MEEAEAVVVAVSSVDASALDLLRALPARAQARFVLVADGGWYVDPAAMAEHRVRAVLWRAETDGTALVQTVRAVAVGQVYLPPVIQGRLLDQLEYVQREVLSPKGLTASGLSCREIDVLRLVSEGMTLSEIAVELSYSQRTIKNIVSGVMIRLGLRNRVQAVSYAIRAGLI
ncbi:helix-turn-helix transcriptional regulator [Streptomyces canus]|uniref:helix-turn-helix transcriptional regulator n=1 Tax=Streptomyces canus TaxID=58343 RepID=UPI0027D8FE20|nr:response regulator transcription factor [Streptomyces canus]